MSFHPYFVRREFIQSEKQKMNGKIQEYICYSKNNTLRIKSSSFKNHESRMY